MLKRYYATTARVPFKAALHYAVRDRRSTRNFVAIFRKPSQARDEAARLNELHGPYDER